MLLATKIAEAFPGIQRKRKLRSLTVVRRMITLARINARRHPEKPPC